MVIQNLKDAQMVSAGLTEPVVVSNILVAHSCSTNAQVVFVKIFLPIVENMEDVVSIGPSTVVVVLVKAHQVSVQTE